MRIRLICEERGESSDIRVKNNRRVGINRRISRNIFPHPIIRSKANIYTREINGQTLANLIFAETSYQIRCFFVLSHSKNSYTIDESQWNQIKFQFITTLRGNHPRSLILDRLSLRSNEYTFP